MQHAVIGPKENQGLGAVVVGILIGKDQRLAVKDITGDKRPVFIDIRVRILIQHIRSTDVVDHLFFAANGIAIYANIAGMAQHHGSQIVVVGGKAIGRIG